MKLNQTKREILARELKGGNDIVTIARMLNVTRYTLYNEFKNAGMNRDNYDAEKAQELATERRSKCRRN